MHYQLYINKEKNSNVDLSQFISLVKGLIKFTLRYFNIVLTDGYFSCESLRLFIFINNNKIT